MTQLSERFKISEAEALRANLYRLLARALSAPADAPFLAILRSLGRDETDLGKALGALAQLAASTDVSSAREEYQNLFIGVGRGELVPYGSYYLTGFLNEKPLARLRNDMAQLGIERVPGQKDPEDHAGALMDMMAGLIDGSFGQPQSLGVQKEFFEKHVGSWMPHFFRNLEEAKNARLYMPVGTIGRIFMDIEDSAFAM